ncbi:MAG: hypothetical protein WCT08_05515 [Patescibacteria group bacterium]|jgi:hypothetical protein
MPDKPKDIFEEVEPANDASPSQRPVVKPQAVMPKQMPNQPTPRKSTFKMRWLWAVIGILVLLILIFLGVIYVKKQKINANGNTNLDINASAAVDNSNSATNISTRTTIEPISSQINDKDKDGLTDEKETELGTNLDLADTDRDGLGDGEEVNVYKTDPRKPDTDGDGIIDGMEVEKGYNPNGAGKLLDFETAKSKLNNSNTNK